MCSRLFFFVFLRLFSKRVVIRDGPHPVIKTKRMKLQRVVVLVRRILVTPTHPLSRPDRSRPGTSNSSTENFQVSAEHQHHQRSSQSESTSNRWILADYRSKGAQAPLEKDKRRCRTHRFRWQENASGGVHTKPRYILCPAHAPFNPTDTDTEKKEKSTLSLPGTTRQTASSLFSAPALAPATMGRQNHMPTARRSSVHVKAAPNEPTKSSEVRIWTCVEGRMKKLEPRLMEHMGRKTICMQRCTV